MNSVVLDTSSPRIKEYRIFCEMYVEELKFLMVQHLYSIDGFQSRFCYGVFERIIDINEKRIEREQLLIKLFYFDKTIYVFPKSL